MKHHIEFDISPHDSYLILDLINESLHEWMRRQTLVATRGNRLPSSVEYDPQFIEARISEFRRIRDIYLAAVRQGRISS